MLESWRQWQLGSPPPSAHHHLLSCCLRHALEFLEVYFNELPLIKTNVSNMESGSHGDNQVVVKVTGSHGDRW